MSTVYSFLYALLNKYAYLFYQLKERNEKNNFQDKEGIKKTMYSTSMSVQNTPTETQHDCPNTPTPLSHMCCMFTGIMIQLYTVCLICYFTDLNMFQHMLSVSLIIITQSLQCSEDSRPKVTCCSVL